MAVSRKLNDVDFIQINDEVTIFGVNSLQALFSLLVERGIFLEPKSRFSSNLACLMSASKINFSVKPKLIRFVGPIFTAKDADDLIEFFSYLKSRGLVFEIVDSALHRYQSINSYFLSEIMPHVRLLSYSADLKSKKISIFSDKPVNRRALIQWSRQLNVVYCIENITAFMKMIDDLNHGYLTATPQDFNVEFYNPFEPVSDFSIEQVVGPTVYYQEISAEAQFNYCLNFIEQAYSQIGGGSKSNQALLSKFSQCISDSMGSKISMILMEMEALLTKNNLFGLFSANFPAEIIALNEDVTKHTCARMLALLMKACASWIEEGPIKASLLELVNPIDYPDRKYAAVYKALEVQLAALSEAIAIEEENKVTILAKK